MKIELVSIGNEILSGSTTNTNSAFISKQLFNQGYLFTRHTTLPDDEDLLKSGLWEAVQCNDLVITTGGLGPTLDDITRQVAADLFKSDFHFDETVAKDLEERYGKNLATLKNQSTVPSEAEVLINTIGTAPGLIFKSSTSTLIMLPGVPNEMKPMLTKQVIPYIINHFPLKEKIFQKSLHLFEIPELAVDPVIRKLNDKYPEISFGIYPSLGIVSVQMKTLAPDEETANKRFSDPYTELESQFATNCFDSEMGTLEEAVHRLFIDYGWTLSIAESCTGGSVASRLTQLPGASNYFLGSIVSYANEVKTKILNIPDSLLRKKGAVSQEVVAKMAEGALNVTGSDFALAVSGIAGPTGGTQKKPVGTVWCAVCRKGETPHTWQLHARGSRDMIITRSVNALFSNLLIYTKETSLL